jgi:hypothetical protein
LAQAVNRHTIDLCGIAELRVREAEEGHLRREHLCEAW